jgi:hypothetical protein
MQEIPAAVQQLIDKQAITEAIIRYSRAADRRDWDLARRVYWPDATDDHVLFSGGVEDFIAFADDFLVDKPTAHFLGNFLIDLLSPTTAFSETYHVAYHDHAVGDGKREDWIFWGRYLDKFEKRGDEWRIIHRTLAMDACTVVPGSSVLKSEAFANLTTLGGSKPDDPLYRFHPRGVDA